MLLLTRARVILGQVRNRSKHNSPIKKKRNAFARRPNFPKRRSTIPGDDRRRLRGSRFEEGRLLFLISGNPIRNEGQVTKRGNSSNRCPTFARGFPCINNERLSRRAGLQALSIFRRERESSLQFFLNISSSVFLTRKKRLRMKNYLYANKRRRRGASFGWWFD